MNAKSWDGRYRLIRLLYARELLVSSDRGVTWQPLGYCWREALG